MATSSTPVTTGPQRRIIMFEDNGDGTMVPAGDAAGPKYRVVSSVGRGDTLDVPMRIRDDDERTAEGAPPSITATKYPEVTLDDINTKPAHDDMDGDDHDTSTDRTTKASAAAAAPTPRPQPTPPTPPARPPP
jgi:hypothetical protein